MSTNRKKSRQEKPKKELSSSPPIEPSSPPIEDEKKINLRKAVLKKIAEGDYPANKKS